MIKADILIDNGWVLTQNPTGASYPEGFVAIAGDRIAAVGPAHEAASWHAERHVDARGGLILPGLVNAHTHAAMTCFRGLADDLPLMNWLNDHIFPAESRLKAEHVHLGTLLACAEMLLSGTTCFCDMYLFEDAVAEAAHAAGMRAVVGEVLYDFPSPNYGPIEDGFRYTEMLIDKWRDDPLITIAVEPHSPYLCAPDLLRKAARLATAHAIPLVIHVSETASEVRTIRERHGASPVQHLADLNVLGPNLLACHCVALDATDMDLLGTHHVKVVHNPESNMKLASGIAPVPDLLARGICVALGTDGCASNNDLDMLSEMDTAAKLHKVATLDPTVVDAEAVLRMATIDGARALGLDDRIGSLEVGKQADLIVIDTRQPHLTPFYRPASHLVYAARGGDVTTTIVAGRILVENRHLTLLDADDIMTRMGELARTIGAQN
ncbi:MAG: amidohydrolase [Desulfobacterales bacterium]|jgi:5-methylthioadenosine/S-adenosylhomocysteine deaminase